MKNIFLIGFMGSGKSTISKMLAEKLDITRVEMDEMIVQEQGMPITGIFEKFGESRFRELESEALREASLKTGAIIATGGGAVLRSDNVAALRENGRIYFIDRPLSALIPTDDRPLSKTREAITARYNERYGIYSAVADVKIDAACDACGVAKRIIGDFNR